MALVTDLPNINPLLYPRGNALRIEVNAAQTYADMYPTSAGVINTFLAAAGGGSGGTPMPSNFSSLGAETLNIPAGPAVGGTVALTVPEAHAVVNGVYADAPSGVTVTLAPGPTGQAGFPGAVSVADNVVTGVTEGLALLRVDVRQGPAGASASLVTYSRYYAIEVAGEA